MESNDRHAPCRQTLISPWRYETGKATLAHGTHSHTRTNVHTHRQDVLSLSSQRHAFCVQMRHIQRLLIYKEALRPPLCPASIKREFEGAEKKEIGLQADLKGKKELKKTSLSCTCLTN